MQLKKQALIPKIEARADAHLLKALGDEVRLSILLMLVRNPGRYCVQEIVDGLPITKEQPTISHHLRILRDANLITYEKRGLYVYYSVKNETIRATCVRLIALFT